MKIHHPIEIFAMDEIRNLGLSRQNKADELIKLHSEKVQVCEKVDFYHHQADLTNFNPPSRSSNRIVFVVD